ncbi:MAG TPA: hypothetical protein VLC93_04345 [Myxococcota bacterium]|nr:hypothetical protein [Myxococcota bacterium]
MALMSKTDALRATASVLVGVATGGYMGTIAKVATPKDASFQTKILLLGAAAAATAFVLTGTGAFGTVMLLGGWLKAAVVGTVVSWALAPSPLSLAALQSKRGDLTRSRY